MTGKQPLIVILGATAVGKTQLAIQIAQQFNGEIIGADSRQIYRYMDIGTAKPTADQRANAPHHLIDIVDPDYNLTLAEYQERAYATIDACHGRGTVPLLVGGTGQYITALVEGWSIPRVPPNWELRAQLEQEVAESGNEAFHQRLAKVDPVAAESIHPNNVRRVIRALEVYLESGTPISVLQQKKPPPYRIYTIGLTLPRDIHYEQADHRVDEMMDAGFLDEVRHLLSLGYNRELPSMSGLGYLELVSHLAGDITLDEAVQKIKFSTHEFIRKQDVWFRGHDNGILWHNVLEYDQVKLSDDIARWIGE